MEHSCRFRIGRLWIARIALVGGAMFVTGASKPLVDTNHSLDISAHALVPITAPGADAILAAGSTALKTDDDGAPGTGDIPCPVNLLRRGAIGGLGDVSIPASITSPSELQAVLAEPTYIKVVRSITYCGAPGRYAGCSITGSMAVKTGTIADGLVWAHEYGHTAGLPHRGSNRELMTDQPLAADQNFVNQDECNHFIAGPSLTGRKNLKPIPRKMKGSAPGQLPPIEELVTRVIVDHMPIALFARYPQSDAAKLRAFVSSATNPEVRGNAMIALGVIGTKADIQPVLDLVANGHALDATPLDTRVAALLALGYYLNRVDAPDVQKVLQAAASNSLAPRLSESALAADDRRVTHRVALSSLALSGRPTALTPFAALGTSDRSFWTDLERTRSQVRSMGLAKYYEEH